MATKRKGRKLTKVQSATVNEIRMLDREINALSGLRNILNLNANDTDFVDFTVDMRRLVNKVNRAISEKVATRGRYWEEVL